MQSIVATADESHLVVVDSPMEGHRYSFNDNKEFPDRNYNHQQLSNQDEDPASPLIRDNDYGYYGEATDQRNLETRNGAANDKSGS